MIGFVKKLVTVLAIVVVTVNCTEAKFFDIEDFDKASSSKSLANSRADSWSVVGNNIIVEGNVYIPFNNITIYADRAIVNTETKDLEAEGNIRIYRTKKQAATLTINQLQELQKNPNAMTFITGYVMNPLGNQKLRVDVYERGEEIKADKVSGNLATGLIEFKNLEVGFKTFFCKADYGIRKPGGELVVKNAKITSCEYLTHGHEHYSLNCSEAKIYPRNGIDSFGFSGYNPDPGEHHIFITGCTLRVFDIPLLWFPFMYKPPDESPGLFKVRGGYESDWGYFMSFSKRFDWADDPYVSSKLLLDWYSLRGVGYGIDNEINYEDSKTSIFAYSIYDIRPYENQDLDKSRMTIPHGRYDFRITNLTHITPRLDFRGRFELLSDMYFRDDFFSSEAAAYPDPPTYGALEYQGDRFSTSLYLKAQINDFYTTVQKLPEFSFDVPRQELFSNIYYQSETTLGYYTMNWREFDKPRQDGNKVDPKDYRTARFDTVHFLYYPFKIGWLNLVPRAGLRLTYYKDSSKTRITDSDLGAMFIVDRPEGTSGLNIKNYDNKGKSIFRFIGEFGLQANTKISRSWLNVKNAYWRLDGLRHVIEPYINYTFIPRPSESRDHIYYFDEIDRIEEQNFIRLGLKNRLQTRRGNYGSESIYTWFSMENYIDYHFKAQDGFNHLGDLGTKLTFSPHPDISVQSLLLLDIGENNAHDTPTKRYKRTVGRRGISTKWINRWEMTVKYKIIEDITTHLSYVYQDPYSVQSTYSMGSTLTDIDSGAVFDKFYTSRIQNIRWGLNFPITPDRKTMGAYEIYYDIEEGAIREQRLKIIRQLHCWALALEFSMDRDRDSDGDIEHNYSVMATLYLTSLASPLEKLQRTTYSSLNSLTGGDS